jgi:hypothetical protein
MANGNKAVLTEMREIVKSGRPIDIDTRDQLLFTAVIDIYDNLECLHEGMKALHPALTFYKVGLFFASALGLGILGFIGALLTGQIHITMGG